MADGSGSAFAANVHHLLGRRFQLIDKDSLQPLGELFECVCELLVLLPSHLRRQCPTLPWSPMTVLSVEFLWQLHGALFHWVQYVDRLQTHLARSSYADTAAFVAAVPDCA